MKNRISETEHILICLKEHIALSDNEDNLLFNYITNLQEENYNYKRLGFKHLHDKNKKLEDRIDKAVEYIKSLEEDYTDYDGEVNIGEIGTHCKENLLNILNGGDEE